MMTCTRYPAGGRTDATATHRGSGNSSDLLHMPVARTSMKPDIALDRQQGRLHFLPLSLVIGDNIQLPSGLCHYVAHVLPFPGPHVHRSCMPPSTLEFCAGRGVPP